MSENITQNSDEIDAFFQNTGYHRTFILEACQELLQVVEDTQKKKQTTSPILSNTNNQENIKFTALWDSTVNYSVVKFLTDNSPNLYLSLISNLYKFTEENKNNLNPRIFEVTAGVLANLLTFGPQNQEIKTSQNNNNTHCFTIETQFHEIFLDLIENLINLDVKIPECLTQVIRIINTTLYIFEYPTFNDASLNNFLNFALTLLKSSYDSELIKICCQFLLTLKNYTGTPESDDKDINKTIIINQKTVIEAVIEGLGELTIEELLEFDVPLEIFGDSEEKQQLKDFYSGKIEDYQNLVDISEKLEEFLALD